MTPGQSLSQLTSKILVSLESYFKSSRPDIVLGHGDTTTCFATAISSFYHQIPFYHVEAGLRTFRLNSPFPEEFNRQSIAPIAFHHFAPTIIEENNLIKDGINKSQITVTGSTVQDAVLKMKNSLNDELSYASTDEKPIVTVTLHRRESSESIEETLLGIRSIARQNKALFICPVHPNPSVQKAFNDILSGEKNIVLSEPLAYPQFISLLLKSQLVITDSGGVQEEAAFLGKKVLLARNETERADGIESGIVELMGTHSEAVTKKLDLNLKQVLRCRYGSELNQLSPSPSEIIAKKIVREIA